MPETSQADLYPLVRGGGIFLMIVGMALVLGGFRFRWRNIFLGIGAAVAAAATAMLAAPLAASYGAPTQFQIMSLLVAVALEIVVVIWAMRRYAPRGERAAIVALLIVVGAHFLLMTPAFGPLIALLGLAAMANALAGAYLPRYPLSAVWAIDGALKAGFGAAMFYAGRLPCVMCAA